MSSSDEIVHRLLREDDEVRAALVERFGDAVLDASGQPDRSAIAAIVFGEREHLAWLERLLHPRVAAADAAWRERVAALPERPAVTVSEIPLLYEVGGESRFDAVVAIAVPPALRAARGRAPQDDRAARQLPDEEKLRRADFAYVNDGSLADLDRFVAGVLQALTAT